jgi:hypothetical protein
VPPERRGVKKKVHLLTAKMFNEAYPRGTVFRYYSVRGDEDFVETKTRSAAWELGHGEPVVLIEGIAGGVCIGHLRHVP